MSLVLVVPVRNLNNVTVSDKIQMMRIIFIGLLTLFLAVSSFAQVTINEEPSVTQLMNVFKTNNQQKPIIRAWRIQVITTTNRSEMDAVNRRFERLYPHLDYKWQHNPPYYQVRVGAYEKKDDLEAFLLQLKNDFPSATPVLDDIKKTELLEF